MFNKKINLLIFLLVLSNSFSYMHNIKYPQARILGINRSDISSHIPFGETYFITNVKFIIEDIIRVGGNEDDVLYINFTKDVHPYLHNAVIVKNEEEIEGDIDFYIIPIEDEVKDHGYNIKQYKNNGEKETVIIDFSSINDPNDTIIDYAIEQTEEYYFKHWEDEEGNIIGEDVNLVIEMTRDIKVEAVFEKVVKKIDGWYHHYVKKDKEFVPVSSALLNFTFYAKLFETSGFILVPYGEGNFFAKRFILEITMESHKDTGEPITIRMNTNRPPVLSF